MNLISKIDIWYLLQSKAECAKELVLHISQCQCMGTCTAALLGMALVVREF
jgi:hypothetical protein